MSIPSIGDYSDILPLWYFPQMECDLPNERDVNASNYLDALQKLPEEEFPGIGAYISWYRQAPPFGNLPGTSEYWKWRFRCPPMPPSRCTRCKSTRIMDVSAKCSDMCNINLDDKSHDGYVPFNLNIGDGDYIMFGICVNCGQMQGTWPLPEGVMEDE